MYLQLYVSSVNSNSALVGVFVAYCVVLMLFIGILTKMLLVIIKYKLRCMYVCSCLFRICVVHHTWICCSCSSNNCNHGRYVRKLKYGKVYYLNSITSEHLACAIDGHKLG